MSAHSLGRDLIPSECTTGREGRDLLPPRGQSALHDTRAQHTRWCTARHSCELNACKARAKRCPDPWPKPARARECAAAAPPRAPRRQALDSPALDHAAHGRLRHSKRLVSMCARAGPAGRRRAERRAGSARTGRGGRGGRSRPTSPCTERRWAPRWPRWDAEGTTERGRGNGSAPRDRRPARERERGGEASTTAPRPRVLEDARVDEPAAPSAWEGRGSGEPAAQARGRRLRLQPAAPRRRSARWASQRPAGRGALRRRRLPAPACGASFMGS